MVVKFGIEIELATKITPETNAVMSTLRNWRIDGDGSVRCAHSSSYGICTACRARGMTQAEFKTAPDAPYTVDLNDITASVNMIARDVKKIYDSLENTSANKSCGIHFHFSGIKKFAVFYSDEFLETLKAKYSAFCRNDSERARFNTIYAEWVSFRRCPQNGERYRALNIRGAYEKHKTFEFRFFPSTKNIETFKRYVRFALEILKEVQETHYDGLSVTVPMARASETETETNETIVKYV